MKKILMPLVLVAVIYIGLRLFDHDEVLQTLDQLEARLLVAWGRLMAYLRNLKGSGLLFIQKNDDGWHAHNRQFVESV
jgi:hypothetical protein